MASRDANTALAERPRNPQHVAPLKAAVQALAPLIERHRVAAANDRRLPSCVFDALADADLMRLWLPEGLGGLELSPLDFMEIVEAAAAVDASIGWLVGNGAGMSRVAGYLDEAVAREWFAKPNSFVVGATGAVGQAVSTNGGYRVTGRWPFGSGVHHASRLMGLCAVPDPDDGKGQKTIACYFSPADIVTFDTWHVSGLRATGSCDWAVNDVFVPLEHTHAFPDPHATQPGLLYRMPGLSVFAWTVSVVPLGIAHCAIERFKVLATQKSRPGTSGVLADREIVQDAVGRADTRHAAARALLVAAMTELMQATGQGGERLVRARINLRAACAFAAESAVHIVDSLAALAGASAIFEAEALTRCVQDVHAAVRHIAMSPNNYGLTGRLGLGRDLQAARF
ncbi:hypothetical protein G3545_16975 [Starkeya sp. ORNL1]|uniref:acyl-CoA dehydrogenase family protein n=1 Tax=Starkeya sp. ORNL1 TaxID=2709380 RepID=UPI0014639856|nr:acyl-CoA dehydrogenase family protein [Starkeya sp. ORNL1]QJP15195.1 hypothetical protein G3545_16975 [Starkeya sp. ORNL1]